MAYDINVALERLEQNLKDISSAHEQVESVVSASSQLQIKVGTFVSEVAKFSQQVEKMVQTIADRGDKDVENFKTSLKKLDKECSAFVSLMDDKTHEIANDFEEKTIKASDSIKSGVEFIQNEVDKIEKAKNDLLSALNVVMILKDDIGDLMKELKKTQSAQNEDLDKIKSDVLHLIEKTDELSKIESKSTESLLKQESVLSQLSLSLNSVNTALSGISPLIQTIQSSLSNQFDKSIGQLSRDFFSTKTEMTNSNRNVEEKVSSLKTILVVQLIISIIIAVVLGLNFFK